MSRTVKYALGCFLLMLEFIRPSSAQQSADLARSTGSPAAIYHGTDLEQVDTSSGNLRITLPLMHLAGRGIDTDIVLTYNSKIWNTAYFPPSDPSLPGMAVVNGDYMNSLQMSGPAGQSIRGGAGWNIGIPRMGVLLPAEADECLGTAPDGSCINDIFHQTFLQSDGGRVALINPNASNLPKWTFDGSFALPTSKGLLYKDGAIAFGAWGNSGQPFQEVLTDTNGNQINCSFASSATSFVPSLCTDTLNRETSFAPNPAGFLDSVTYIDSTSISRSITFQYTQFSVNYPFSESNANCNWFSFTPVTVPLLTSVTLANGLSYKFQYLINPDGSTTAEMSKLILPTGGYIRYEYDSAPVSTADMCNFVHGSGQNRVVTSRFVSPDGASGSEQKWSYAFTAEIGSSRTATITDPSGNSQVYIRPWGSSLPSEVDYKDPTGRTLESILGKVESYPPASTYFYTSTDFSNPRYTTVTTVLNDTTQQSQVTYSYDAFNNVTEKDETDWGFGGPGAVLRKSTFAYLADANPAYAANSVHILDRVMSATICDAGSTFCSQTTTNWDDTPLA